jgi:hypothetical protein
MRLAVISTTIHGEAGYLPFDRLAKGSKFDSVHFYIAGDLTSKPFDATKFSCPVVYLDADAQKKYQSSEAIGWKKIMRRNIALLEAIQQRPDFILSIDDDNVPEDDYFDRWHEVVTTPKARLIAPPESDTAPHWHNYLASSDAPIEIYPRGFPIAFRHQKKLTIADAKEAITPERIGVFQGISLGHPDIDALTRVVHPEPIHSVAEKNYCLKNVWSPYNSQNTIIATSLFPVAFMWPYAGRYDDIYASFVWQKLLFNNDMFAYVGDPVNTQTDRRRGVMKDFENEIEGYMRGQEVWERINAIEEKDPVRFIEQLARTDHEIIQRNREYMLAHLADLKNIL